MDLTRREALKALGATTLAVALGSRDGRAAPSRGARPNILWLSCEDISPHIGCYGDPHAITPAIDALAAAGIRYTNAFTTAGVCAPCRSCIITGMYASTLGSQHMRSQAVLPETIRCFPEYLRKAGYYCTNNSKTDYNFRHAKSTWDESSGKAHWRNRKPGQPFFAVFNYTGTHEGRIRSSESQHAKLTRKLTPEQRQDPKKLTLPPYYPDTPVVRRDWARNYELITGMDYWVAGMLKELEDAGLADDTIVFFWSDHGVGLPRAKRWLYDSGTHVPLIVRIPEKFRTGGQGKPGTVTDELVSFIDLAPTVLNLTGVEIPEHMQGRAFLGRNLTPPREYIYGARDRMDERYDIIRTVRDKRYRYIRNYEPFKAYYQYMNTADGSPVMQELRRLHAKGELPPAAAQFMADTKPVEELYDIQIDSYEVKNLGDSAAHNDVLQRMRAAHEKWVIETRDTGLIPEPELVERSKTYGSGYAILRQPGAEQLIARLRDVAALAGRPKRADLPPLLEALKDDDAAVRYWAAIGLGNLGDDARSAANVLTSALADQSASVRIAAARALCKMGLEEKALPVLTKELKDGAQWTRLSAAIVLGEIGEQARPVIPALKEAMKPRKELYAGGKYVVRVVNRTLNVLLGTNNRVK